MTLADFHAFCRQIKSALDTLPEGSTGALWGWLTTGQLTGDDAARGLVTGLLGPMIVSGLAKRPPSGPSSGVTTGLTPGAPPHPSPSSLGAKCAGPVVTLLLRFAGRLTTKRAGLTRPSSLPRDLFVGVNKMVAIATGAALIQGCAPARPPERDPCYLQADAEALRRYNSECAGYASISECPSGIVEPIEVEHQAAQEACK